MHNVDVPTIARNVGVDIARSVGVSTIEQDVEAPTNALGGLPSVLHRSEILSVPLKKCVSRETKYVRRKIAPCGFHSNGNVVRMNAGACQL
jgi:hypothetical protein